MLNDTEKNILLKIARDTINEYIKNGKKTSMPEVSENLSQIQGAFVTLTKNGQLRGCIGNIVGINPLAKTIQEMAISASTEDPRFPAVTPDEIDNLKIEISVLSKLEKIKPEDVEVGKHGLLIKKGIYQGVLLPQVPTEYGWTREEFLKHTCLKAGLDENAWIDEETELLAFTAEVFGEENNSES